MPTPHHNTDHVDVGAYVLGILDEPDDAAFQQHFARCARCRAEFRELSDLPLLLDQLKPARREQTQARTPALPSKRVLNQTLARITSARRTRNRTMWLGAAAAAVLLVAVPLVIVRSSGNDTQTAAPTTVTVSVSAPTSTADTSATGTDVVAGARTVTGSNPETGVSVRIGMEPQPWGTGINLELRATTGPQQCQLVAVSRTGEIGVVTSWLVPAGGIGVTNEPLRMQGGVGIAAENIARFELRRADGPNLLNIPT
jgi:Putative zinc-finger